MHPKRFALIGGIIMLAVGLLSLIPNLVGPIDGLPVLRVQESYGYFLGLVPMNIVNKLVLIFLGVAGIYSANERFTNLPASIHYSRWVFAIAGALAILGLIPQTNTLFGYAPLFGYDVWFHAVIAVAGAYFGFALTAKVPDQSPNKNTRMPAHGL